MLSPDKYIRKYFYDFLSAFAPVFDERQVTENETLYFVIRNQTKDLRRENKCFEHWQTNTVIEVVQRSLGTSNKGSRVVINDLEQEVINAYNSVNIQGFIVLAKEYNSTSFITEGIRETLDRQIININLKLK